MRSRHLIYKTNYSTECGMMYQNCHRNSLCKCLYLVHHNHGDTCIYHGPLVRYENCGLRIRRGCRERFPRHRGLIKPVMHHGTCVTHVPWCRPGSLTTPHPTPWSEGQHKSAHIHKTRWKLNRTKQNIIYQPQPNPRHQEWVRPIATANRDTEVWTHLGWM